MNKHKHASLALLSTTIEWKWWFYFPLQNRSRSIVLRWMHQNGVELWIRLLVTMKMEVDHRQYLSFCHFAKNASSYWLKINKSFLFRFIFLSFDSQWTRSTWALLWPLHRKLYGICAQNQRYFIFSSLISPKIQQKNVEILYDICVLIEGDVYAIDESTLFIKGFAYDGTGPDAFFWVGR